MDQHPLGIADRLEPEPHRLLPFRPACDDFAVAGHPVAAQQPPRRLHPLGRHRHHQARHAGGPGEGAQGVDEERRPPEAEILLGPPRAHAGPGSPRGNHHHGLSQCPDSSVGAGRAKIIRPAVVCSTLVTVTSSIWPMYFLP